MFNVVFYEFNKRPNSTKRPTSSTPSATFACSMKAPSSLTAPQIELSLSGSTVPKWNYCYIADLGQRYFYIERTFYDLGIWTFQLTVDVLATYYSDIWASSQYIARSATHYNSDLIDTIYPTKLTGTAVQEYGGVNIGGDLFPYGAHGSTSAGTAVSVSNYFNKPFKSGSIVMGLKSGNATGVTYYAMNVTAFNYFINKTFALHPSMSSDTTTAFANAVFDPLQYVTAVRWYPALSFPSSATTTTTINIGSEPINMTGYTVYVLDDIYYIEWDCQIDLPVHPQATTYSYLKLTPYTELTLYMEPFGFIPLDTTRLYRSTKLTIYWKVDYMTGTCTFRLSGTAADDSDVFLVNTYPYGVELPISTLITDMRQAAIATGLQLVKGALNYTPAKKNVEDMTSREKKLHEAVEAHGGIDYEPDGSSISNVNTLLDTFTDIVAATMGQVRTVGAVNSFLGYFGMTPKIYATFYSPVDMDIARFGRPYFTRGNMSSESGYVVCMNASVNFSVKQPLPVESRAVIMSLNTGIYLE